MNFLGVGPAELIVILVVALVFVGPERLPKLAADLARTIREIRKYTGSLAAEFNEVIQDFEKDTADERSAWKEIKTGITGATKSVTDAVRDVRTEMQSAGADTAGRQAIQPNWAEIPSAPPDAQPGIALSAANGTNGASAIAPTPLPAEEAR